MFKMKWIKGTEVYFLCLQCGVPVVRIFNVLRLESFILSILIDKRMLFFGNEFILDILSDAMRSTEQVNVVNMSHYMIYYKPYK